MSSSILLTNVQDVAYNNDFKKIVILLLMIGILMIFIGYQQEKSLSPFPQVIYKYIPKSYYDEMFSQMPIISTFSKLFNSASPWEAAKPGYDQYNDIYTYNHFTRKGAYNFYDHQDSYYEY
jgi:hypothetical protein